MRGDCSMAYYVIRIVTWREGRLGKSVTYEKCATNHHLIVKIIIVKDGKYSVFFEIILRRTTNRFYVILLGHAQNQTPN